MVRRAGEAKACRGPAVAPLRSLFRQIHHHLLRRLPLSSLNKHLAPIAMAATTAVRSMPYSQYSSWPQPQPQHQQPHHHTHSQPHHHQQQSTSHHQQQSQHVPQPAGVAATSQSSMEAPPLLVATGRKRKRLQRACVACHKAKRRCDGGLPCSNCDFSGRTCCYSDSQGKTVAPTQRTLKPSEAALQDQQLYAVQQQQRQQQQQATGMPLYENQSRSAPSSMNPRGSPSSGPSYSHSYSHSLSPAAEQNKSPREYAAPLSKVEPSLETRRELLCIFFSHIQPLNSILDEISLLRDLSSNEVPWVLLYAMYAVSAEYAYDVHHQQQQQLSPRTSGNADNRTAKYSKVVAEAGNGSCYATEARKLLYREDEQTGQSMIDGKARVEVAQALCLLAFYEFGQRRYFRASSYIQLGSKHISALSVNATKQAYYRDGSEYTTVQARNLKRLACLMTAMDVSLSMMSGQSMTVRPINIDLLSEACRREGSPRPEDDEDTSAMTYLYDACLILNRALDLRQASRNGAPNVEKRAGLCEQDLHRWADDLPRQLQYDQSRLQSISQLLNNTRNGSPSMTSSLSKSAAVCWTMMHTVAETTTLILKEMQNHHGDRRSRDLAACNNIVILLEQSNPAALPKLFAALGVAVLYSVTSSSPSSPTTGEDREWSRVADMARSFAGYSQLGDAVWTSMASWWNSSRFHSRSPSGTIKLRYPSPPTNGHIYRRPISTSPSMQPNRSSSLHQTSPPSNYHYLPPLNSLNGSSTLPPLRLPSTSSESSTKRGSWDQPTLRSLTVDLH